MPLWLQIVLPILTFILGAVLGLFICRKIVKKEIDKNPPINKEMIRALYSSMGRTPSEAQVNAAMRNVMQAQKNGNKKR